MRKLNETWQSWKREVGRVTGLHSFWSNLQQGFREYKAWFLIGGAVIGFALVLWLFKSILWHIGDTYRLLTNIHKSVGVLFLLLVFAGASWVGHFIWKTWRSVQREKEEKIAAALAEAEADFNASDPGRYLPDIDLPALSFYDLFQPGHHRVLQELASARTPREYEEALQQLRVLNEEENAPDWKLSEASILIQMGRVERALQLLVEVQEDHPKTTFARDARSLVIATCLEFALPVSRYRAKNRLEKTVSKVREVQTQVKAAITTKATPSVPKQPSDLEPIESTTTEESPLDDDSVDVLEATTSSPTTLLAFEESVDSSEPMSTPAPKAGGSFVESLEIFSPEQEALQEVEEAVVPSTEEKPAATTATKEVVVAEKRDDVEPDAGAVLESETLLQNEEMQATSEPLQEEAVEEPPIPEEPPPPPMATLGGIPLQEVLLLEKLLDEGDRLRQAGERGRSEQLFEEIVQRAPTSRYAKDVRLRRLSDELFFQTSRAHGE